MSLIGSRRYREYLRGASVEQIADREGVTPSAVYRSIGEAVERPRWRRRGPTDAARAVYRARRERGEPTLEAAEASGISIKAARRINRELGMARSRRPAPALDRVAKLWRQKFTAAEIAEKTGTTEATVATNIRRARERYGAEVVPYRAKGTRASRLRTAAADLARATVGGGLPPTALEPLGRLVREVGFEDISDAVAG